MKSPVAPVFTIASDEASSIISIVFRWIGSMMQFRPCLSEQILSIWDIRFSHLGLHNWWVVEGISEDEGSYFEVSLINFEISDTSLSISSSWRSRTENWLLLDSGGPGHTIHPLRSTKFLRSMLSRTLTMSRAANLSSSSFWISLSSIKWMSKWHSQSFTQCPVFPQYWHVSGRAFAFLATLISMGTGLPGMGVECVKEGRLRKMSGFSSSKRSKSMWCRLVYARLEKLHLPHDSDPSGQWGRTTCSDLCLKAFS